MRPIAVAFLAVVIVAGAFTAFYGVTSRSAPPERAGTDRPQVVLFVGDGMGLATVTAARIEKGTREGLPHPSAARLHIDEAPAAALVTTHSEDGLVTDSAASATAFLTGSKVPNGVVSWRRASDGAVDSLETVLELAIRQGLATGVVTTTRLTHATPACTFAHVPDRGWETEIAAALVPEGGNPRLGRGIDVILGGGFREFLPSGPTRPGTRTDGRDILAELERSGYQVVRTRSELAQAAAANSEKLFGAFAPSHMTYEIDRESTSPNEPSLLEMVQSAVGQLRNKPNGFFLLVEGGRIDHAHHDTNGRRAIEEMLEFDEAPPACCGAEPGLASLFRGNLNIPTHDSRMFPSPGMREVAPGATLDGAGEVALPLSAWHNYHPDKIEALRAPITRMQLELQVLPAQGTEDKDWQYETLDDGSRVASPFLRYLNERATLIQGAPRDVPVP